MAKKKHDLSITETMLEDEPYENCFTKQVVQPEVKPSTTHKVQFVSTLFLSAKQGYLVGTVTELTDEVYQIAKKYNSIKDL